MSTGSVGIPGLAAIVPTPTAPMPLDEALRDAEELYALAADRLFSLLAIGSTWK
jgi:glycerate kinase